MKLAAFLILFLNSFAWACPPCPSGSSYSGSGATTSTAGCRCSSGTATWNGSACVEPTVGCSSVSRTWLTNCGASLPASAHLQVRTVSNSNVNYNGSATYTCNNGTWSSPSSTSCAIKTCAGGTKTWLTNCSASVSTVSATGSTTVSNSAAGYTGSATFACNDGTWGAPTSTSCTANPSGCAAGTVAWNTYCSRSVAAASDGQNLGSLSSTASSGQGSATISCSGTTWVTSSTSCTRVYNQTNICSAPVGAPCSPDFSNGGIVDSCGCPGGRSTSKWCQGGQVQMSQLSYCA